MPGVSTIVIAREDFSIPDGDTGDARGRQTEIEGQVCAFARRPTLSFSISTLPDGTVASEDPST
jgi:hypothetical protein